MKSIILFELTNFRWLGFFLAMLGVYLLSDGDYFGNPIVQSIGWGSACLSAFFWVIMGIRDKDIPRTFSYVDEICSHYSELQPLQKFLLLGYQ